MTALACDRCEQPFTPVAKARGQRFCSKECRHAAWTSANRARLNETVRNYRRRRYQADGRWRDEGEKARSLRAWMVEIKSNPCADCGGSFDVCCMDFDHRDASEKKFNVGSMFAHHYSRELIEAEVAKCDLVCANCHRIRTRNRRTGSARGVA